MAGEIAKVRVLFVCTGNICRSPTAEGVFRAMVDAAELTEFVEIDSAGTAGYHAGEPPDARSQQAALARGFDLSDQRARQVRHDDFETFDFVVAMDRTHHRALLELCPENEVHRVKLFLEYAPQVKALDVPDPYYGVLDGFNYVLDIVEAASTGLLQDVRAVLQRAK